ncbi:MAG: carboxypeptidase regulatory-like domain-containing protein [Acidobacteriia bacterium]|nr:carboxypeptidase regulatory-like domain-containing protein [Terriglobia bacterium]
MESIEPIFLSRWNLTGRSSVRSLNDVYSDAQQHPSAATLNRLKEEYLKIFPGLPAGDKRKLAAANNAQAVNSLFYSTMDQGMRVRLKVKTLFKHADQDDDDDVPQKAVKKDGKPSKTAGPTNQKAKKDDDDDDRKKQKKGVNKDVTKDSSAIKAKPDDRDSKDEDSFEIWTAFGDCGIDFQAGETYLVYANSDEGTDYLFTSSCTRTRRLSDSGEDLAYLFFYKNHPEESARLEGFVTTNAKYKLDSDPLHNPSSIASPVVGSVVELQSDRITRYAESDRDGRFLFDGLRKGRYNVSAFVKGYPQDPQLLAGPEPLEIENKGCAIQVLLAPKKDGN